MEMKYDSGSTTTFKITYLGCSDLERGKDSHYSYIKVIQNIISHQDMKEQSNMIIENLI